MQSGRAEFDLGESVLQLLTHPGEIQFLASNLKADPSLAISSTELIQVNELVLNGDPMMTSES